MTTTYAASANDQDFNETHCPSIEEVVEAVKQLGERDDHTIKAVLGVVLSINMEARDPLWLLIAGPAGSNKTTLVDLIKGHEDVYRVDTLTANPFIGGQKDSDNPKDLLKLLDKKCFVVKEYSTILEGREDVVRRHLSDMTAIYDGEYTKHSSVRGTVTYESSFSHIGCITESVLKKRQHYMSRLGQRFLILRRKGLKLAEHKAALKDEPDVSEAKPKAQRVVQAFLRCHKEKVKDWRTIIVSDEAKQLISQAASFVARGRAAIEREKDEIVDCDLEAPYRLRYQLTKLAIILAIVNGHASVGTDELKIVFDVAISSASGNRAKVLRSFANGLCYSVAEVAQLNELTCKTAGRILADLMHVGLVSSKMIGNNRIHSISEEFKEILSLGCLQVFLRDKTLDTGFSPGSDLRLRDLFGGTL